MVSRVVHRVRCRKKDNNQVWADVKVVDAVSMAGTDGKEKLLYIKAKSSVPYIVDKTTGKNGKGDPGSASRTSHMVLAESAEDPSQKMYIEILDTLAIVNVTPRSRKNQAGAFQDIERRYGSSEAALDGAGEITLVFPDSRATRYIFDKTGLELGAGNSNTASRSGHVSLVTEKGNTDDNTDGIKENGDTIPPKKLDWCAVLKPDALHVSVTGGQVITLYIPKGAQDELDTTTETTDPITGLPCPPDNTDPNVYVAFPLDGVGDPNAPCVGCNVHIPTINEAVKPIDQGPLWWIERISSPFQPWFWFATVQEPKAFSFFGNPGRLGSWAYRGFVLWNNYPVIWILARNNPLISMGSFGSPSLDLCARIGNWDFAFDLVPSLPIFIPQRPQTINVPFSALSFTGPIPQEEPSTYGPFGCLQMTHPPLGSFPDAVPYGNTLGGNTGSELWSQRPNIWQLTGLPQPKRADMSKPWDPFTNPIVPPSAKDAKAAAILFRDNWNSAADGHNDFISGSGFTSGPTRATYNQPPGWNWEVPYYDPILLGVLKYGGAFFSGIPYGVGTAVGIPLVDFIPATAYKIEVDQLDPKIWDTSKLELYSNPINWFLPLVIPPLLKPTT